MTPGLRDSGREKAVWSVIKVLLPMQHNHNPVFVLSSKVLQDEIFLFVSAGGWLGGWRCAETVREWGQSSRCRPACQVTTSCLPAQLILNTDNIIDLSLLTTLRRRNISFSKWELKDVKWSRNLDQWDLLSPPCLKLRNSMGGRD